ncbi:uncharacterized protein SCHCODRAFT_02003620 [Schizophyllum commune H4-8]|nr:uncharacterized protein SCHCODRAFT_02003620 [Schizophyllum commune H4-8]KAI5899146.1 hypothetical protein SCHCODRAFT_02003620 [Schizophyllum commune H4-8]
MSLDERTFNAQSLVLLLFIPRYSSSPFRDTCSPCSAYLGIRTTNLALSLSGLSYPCLDHDLLSPSTRILSSPRISADFSVTFSVIPCSEPDHPYPAASRAASEALRNRIVSQPDLPLPLKQLTIVLCGGGVALAGKIWCYAYARSCRALHALEGCARVGKAALKSAQRL